MITQTGKEIDCSQIYFAEFEHLAISVNAILREKKVSEEKYRNIFDTAMVLMFLSQFADGLFLEVNKKAVEATQRKL